MDALLQRGSLQAFTGLITLEGFEEMSRTLGSLPDPEFWAVVIVMEANYSKLVVGQEHYQVRGAPKSFSGGVSRPRTNRCIWLLNELGGLEPYSIYPVS